MCDRPEARQLETTYQEYLASNEVYIIGACTNFDEIDSLRSFQLAQEVTFPMTGMSGIGNYLNDYGEIFNAIGGNMVLVGNLPNTAQSTAISLLVETSIGSLEGVFVSNSIEDIAMTNGIEIINLNEHFTSTTGEDLIFSISNNSNPDAVHLELTENDYLIITQGNTYGLSNISVNVSPSSNRLDHTFTVFNPSVEFDGFETGDFSSQNWTSDGASSWVIDDSTSSVGSFSAKSGIIDGNQESRLNLTVNVLEDSEVSFSYKVSSELQYDMLYFKVDGVWQNGYGWTGDTGWQNASFPLSAGTHELVWGYHKDGTGTQFEDCAWIDNVILPGEYVVEIDVENNYELSIMNYELKQNYPNPFNPVTKINFQYPISNNQYSEIVVHNSAGQKVWSSNPLTLNPNHCLFDGSKFNSGIYYYSLVVDKKVLSTKSMILLK